MIGELPAVEEGGRDSVTHSVTLHSHSLKDSKATNHGGGSAGSCRPTLKSAQVTDWFPP